MKGGEFLDLLSDYWLLKKGFESMELLYSWFVIHPFANMAADTRLHRRMDRYRIRKVPSSILGLETWFSKAMVYKGRLTYKAPACCILAPQGDAETYLKGLWRRNSKIFPVTSVMITEHTGCYVFVYLPPLDCFHICSRCIQPL